MEQLWGRNALVTGSSSGIGRHIAQALAREGMNVVACGRSPDALERAVAELRALGVRAEAVAVELADAAQAEGLIERATAALGPLDVLVNNAGVELASSFTRYSREELISIIDINLTAPIVLTRQVLPGMLERGRGHVVFTSSVAGKVPPAYQAPYAASKAGLIALSRSLRMEYRDAPVGFSVVCPGFTAGDGMYQRMLEQGLKSNRIMGETTVDRIAATVVSVIRHDRPEAIESGSRVAPIAALSEIAPRLMERVLPRVGVNDLFRRLAASHGRD
jgi:short-subunit dehydrogenase